MVNYAYKFLTKSFKLFVSLNGKTDQKATKTALAVCSMFKITFLQEVLCVISGYIACRLAPKLL